jgi:hypothetical protein
VILERLLFPKGKGGFKVKLAMVMENLIHEISHKPPQTGMNSTFQGRTNHHKPQD